jgi:hypothetical protein
MNITFSGDTRDLFKFDLVRHLMKSIPGLDTFTFIPMLTDPAGPAKKSRKADLARAVKDGRAGSQNRELMEHLGKLQEIEDDMAYLSGIHTYFTRENILIKIPNTNRFSHKQRESYFLKMFEGFPERSLIFLDPDNGLEVKNPTQQHLLFDEVRKIADAMDNRSILMIYQHLPRLTREGYIRDRCSKLTEVTGLTPVSITDNEIVFFLCTKDPRRRARLQDIVDAYADTYEFLQSCPCE